MQTATATVAGRRRVSFTLPEPAATTFIPRDVESEGRRSTWPPTRTERYPEGLRKARALWGKPGDGSGQGSECSRRWPRCVERFEAVVESLALRRGVS